ncbi:MAG: PHP domain-containing protein [Candidatus Woesearchaeota archaeon]
MDKADLHVHTTISDGTFSPSQVVFIAAKIGLQAIAITDHDSVGGIDEATETLRKYSNHINVEIISGVEISTDFPNGRMHILGFCINHGNADLNALLERGKESRKNRELGIIEKLNSLGMSITIDEVRAITGKKDLSRPEFAKALLHKKCVADIHEAFSRYLKKGMPAYVRRDKVGPAEAIDAIRAAGGIPVLAHPTQLKLGTEDLRELIADLVPKGLQGIEVYYPSHTRSETDDYTRIAEQHHLIQTGGSDFHGLEKPAIWLGQVTVSYRLVELLKNQSKSSNILLSNSRSSSGNKGISDS